MNDSQTLADLLARDRRSDRPGLRAGDREMDYRRVCTTAYKAGNYLRLLGVDEGRPVAVADDPRPQPVLTFLGAALLAAPTRFATRPERIEDARVVLVPAARESAVDDVPGRVCVVYGDEPAAASTAHWEGNVWSENPAFPPSAATPETPALVSDERTLTHGECLEGARRVVEELGVTESDDVVLEAGLSDPRAVVAGVVAPLLTGARAVLGGEERQGVRVGERRLPLSEVY